MDADGTNVQAADRTRPATTAARSSRRLLEDRLARLAAQARARSSTTIKRAARAGPGAADASSSSASPTPTAPTRARSPTSAPPRSRRSSSPTASASSSRRTTAIPQGREFDLWAIDVDGTRPRAHHLHARLRRLPDVLARRQAPRVLLEPRPRRSAGDTNVFVAALGATAKRRADAGGAEAAARRPLPRRRRAGSPTTRARAAASAPPGLAAAAACLAAALPRARPRAGRRRRHATARRFDVPMRGAASRPGTALALDGAAGRRGRLPAGGVLAPTGEVEAEVVAAGYGIAAPELGVDDYAGLDVEGQDRRRAPLRAGGQRRSPTTEAERRYGDLRYKAFNAREHGAVGAASSSTCRPASGERRCPTRRRCRALEAGGRAATPASRSWSVTPRRRRARSSPAATAPALDGRPRAARGRRPSTSSA